MLTKTQFLNSIKGKGKVNILALDMGFRFIGVASGFDVFGKINIKPETTIDLEKEDFYRSIVPFISNKHGIVVGFTRRNESLSLFSQKKIQSLRPFINIPAVFTNEDYSTVTASKVLSKMNSVYALNRYALNQGAACVILSQFIESSKAYV